MLDSLSDQVLAPDFFLAPEVVRREVPCSRVGVGMKGRDYRGGPVSRRRAIESGRPAALAPDALVFHAEQRHGVRGSLRVARRWEAAIRVFADHPQTRHALPRLFWNVWRYLPWRGTRSGPPPHARPVSD